MQVCKFFVIAPVVRDEYKGLRKWRAAVASSFEENGMGSVSARPLHGRDLFGRASDWIITVDED
jgi:hypothetical protein